MNSYGSLTEIVNSIVEERTNSGYTITIEKTCDSASKETYTPAIGTAHPTRTAFTLNKAMQLPLAGGLCKITLQYVAANEELPEKSYSEQTSYVEVDIQEHPNFNDWADDWDSEKAAFKSTSSKAGIKSYIKGSTTVTVAQYFSSKPSSPYEDVGQLESPGADYGGSENWLIIGATRSKQGNFWVVEKNYLYSSKEYNTDIYS